MTSSGSLSARAMARRLLERETAGITDPTAIAAALQRTLVNVSANLQRWVGHDGYAALLVRALRSAEAHPALTTIRRVDDAGIHLDGVAAAVEAHGSPAVVAALEALLTAIIDLLSSLIGADIVWNLLDDNGPAPQTPSGQETP